jgi:crotonobetainyl-CoA:carnitine CoA-transferase CaiB-like acyl-CoA transferase
LTYGHQSDNVRTMRTAFSTENGSQAAGATADMLTGVRVLDLTHVLAGPFCTMILGDIGAEVIKMEPVELGDQVRHIPPLVGGESFYFVAVNRNKQSVAADLKDARVKAIVSDLAASCDVVVDNFRPGVMKRLGLDHETLVARNPDVITCSISGFGSEGPWSERPAFDLVTQAMSGIMSITGEPDGSPMRCGIPIGDLAGGLWSAIAILGALNRRSTTGVGAHLEIALLDGLLGLLGYLGQLAILEGKNPARVGNGHQSIVPYGRYETSDGEIVIALHVGDFWRTFIRAAGREELLDDPRFDTAVKRKANREELEEIVAAILRQRTTSEWETQLLSTGVPHGRISTVLDALQSDYAQSSGILRAMAHPTAGSMNVVASPIRVDGARVAGPSGAFAPSPLHGEHTAAVFAELGVQVDEIGELIASGAIRSAADVAAEIASQTGS